MFFFYSWHSFSQVKEQSEKKQMIVLYPLMAQGHITPLVVLALELEQGTKYNIAIVNTSLNIKKLKSSLPRNSSVVFFEILFTPSKHREHRWHPLPPHHSTPRSHHYHETSLQAPHPKHPPPTTTTTMHHSWHLFRVDSQRGKGTRCFSRYLQQLRLGLWTNLTHRHVDSDPFPLPDFSEARFIYGYPLA